MLRHSKSIVVFVVAIILLAVALPAAQASADELKSIRSWGAYDSTDSLIINKYNQYVYTGSPICPVSYLMDEDGNKVVKGNFLTYYFKNRKIGTATVVLRGVHSKGYKDAQILSYKIISKAAAAKMTLKIARIPDQTWTGSAINPPVTVTANGKRLTKGTDYTVSYYFSTNIGPGEVKVTGKGAYKGKTTWSSYRIVKANLSDMTVSNVPTQKYTGAAITPKVTVTHAGKTLDSSNYVVNYSNNTQPGIATITITGTGAKVVGSRQINFKISKPFSAATITAIPDQAWTGGEVRPHPLVTIGDTKLVEGTDYFLTYENNINASTGKSAILTVNPKGEYAGETAKTATYRIAVDLSAAQISLPYTTKTYTGDAITQVPTVWHNGTQVSASNYTVDHRYNTEVGTAYVTITGKGSYMNSVSTTFTIEQADIAQASIECPAVVNIGSASEVKPTVTVTYNGKTLMKDVDYTLQYRGNDKVGIGSVLITGHGNFKGSINKNFTINS